ncbi:50S ribosomal protein L5 [Patescibacteria group bacterium]|nr:50S ribosomal protein L5 [Patescibacteria group bacterium]MBU0776803.1 50S ribosomal protein L5 [Patescibacteria group bacterium]MBU0845622.1 50S ribosomal protein L5 [Patescibacteria group bacterium]MBU0922664.1 50S ribosomal protein L5 [Patescibacteria group bacterium]MBU1066715.1 50S ribosomal protein L5 [Patescibacteria group bacterium]
MSYISLKDRYETEISKKLEKELGIKNKMAIPRVEKVVVNMGIGDLVKNKEGSKSIMADLATIIGQKPSVRPAKISVAGFNVREGMPVGLSATLRGKRMYDFLEKLFTIVLPRLRDFRGLSLKSFDGSGNYTMGIVEHIVFPEIDINKAGAPRGLEVTIVTNTNDIEESKKMLILMGMPLEKEEESEK